MATSPDVPGLVAEGRSVTEAVEIAQGMTRKIVESCLEHGDPLPPALADQTETPPQFDLLIPDPPSFQGYGGRNASRYFTGSRD